MFGRVWYNPDMEKPQLESQQENQEIAEKVKLIEQINTGSEQKAQLVLTVLGIKPAAELSLYKWNSSPEKTEELLEKIGFLYERKKMMMRKSLPNTLSL